MLRVFDRRFVVVSQASVATPHASPGSGSPAPGVSRLSHLSLSHDSRLRLTHTHTTDSRSIVVGYAIYAICDDGGLSLSLRHSAAAPVSCFLGLSICRVPRPAAIVLALGALPASSLSLFRSVLTHFALGPPPPSSSPRISAHVHVHVRTRVLNTSISPCVDIDNSSVLSP